MDYFHCPFCFYSSQSPLNTNLAVGSEHCGSNYKGTKTKCTLFPSSCSLLSPKCINQCRQCRFRVDISNLTFLEETKVHHLYSIATDWTLLIDRQAANCRNISDEVFPSIFLGDRYEFFIYHF